MALAQTEFKTLRENFIPLKEDFLNECCTDGVLDMNTLAILVDLFVYLPKKKDKHAAGTLSPDVFMVLSGNSQNKATTVETGASSEDIQTRRNLELMWSRISDRFKTLSAAFRFFDVNFNNEITFNEFTKSLEAIKLKIPVKEQQKIFAYLDQGSKGYITYDDFCNITDERRRKIDPAKEMIDAYRNKDAQS